MLRNRWIKALVFVMCLAPLGWLVWRFWHDNLTANPIEYITHLTGDWTIRFIVLTLAVTPLRRLLGLVDLVRFRRMLGLFAFFYGMLHFLTWFWLDKALDFHEIAQDVLKRRFVTVGFLALLLMLPLAATSTQGWIRRMGGKRWQLLHRLVYVTAIAGVVHYYWLVKSDIRLPALYGAIVAILLGSRLLGPRKGPAKSTTLMTLSHITRHTADTVTLRFPFPNNMPFGAKPGQFMTFDWIVGGKKVPRSYSISSSPLRSDYFEVTVKQQGVVSTFLNRDAKVGLQVEAHGPFGRFCFDKSRHRDIVLFAGGSGITPIMSMLRYIDEAAPDTKAQLFYAVRTEQDIVFQEELAAIQGRLTQFRFHPVVSRGGTAWTGSRGRVDRTLIAAQMGEIGERNFFLCGPVGFMAAVKEILLSLGARPEQIEQERFTLGAPEPAPAIAARFSVEFANSGETYECTSGDLLLTIAEEHGIDIRSNCRVGQCGTCATRVIAGEVEMETDEGLDASKRADGFRLMCVGRARSNVRLEA